MTTIDSPAAIPSDVMERLQEAAEKASKGTRDSHSMRLACERMDRMRAETFRNHGMLDIGGPAIRELRDT